MPYDSGVYQCSFAGVAVTYSKPFTMGDGLGQLPNYFKELPVLDGIPLQQVHDYLVEARNFVYAHTDHLNQPTMLGSSPAMLDALELQLEFRELGFTCITTEPIAAPENLANILRLLRYQRERINARFNELIRGTIGGLPTSGRYKVTENGLVPVSS